MTYKDTPATDIDVIMQQAWTAFLQYRQSSLQQRADFMRAIAEEIEALGEALLQVAAEESHLPVARLKTERTRTIYQLKSYADACVRGQWMDIRINTANPDGSPPAPDLRKLLVPLGPVVVFGASNFPFAYSTAGGDTACALAAGCPVIVKAHPAHARTSAMVADAILKAAANLFLPQGIFSHVYGGNETGKALVMHPFTKAVGFTGSLSGGRALYNWANERKDPIPVFAEMGSVNPVFLLPGKMQEDITPMAKMLADSVLLSAGQFCTNPGLIIGIDNDHLAKLISQLAAYIQAAEPATMLHTGIFKGFVENRALALSQEGVDTIAVAEKDPLPDQGLPTIAATTGSVFLQNPILQQEVFGPYTIVIRCADMDEMMQVALRLEGQLTATLMATSQDITSNENLVEAVKNICGRLIMNGVPTGVAVSLAMQHGGPYPATTDSRFSAVGADGIRRFARPLCFQNWDNNLLPDELKNENPLGIWRTVNDVLTDKKI